MTVKSLFIASVDHIQGAPWQTGLHLLAGNVELDLVFRPTDFSHRSVPAYIEIYGAAVLARQARKLLNTQTRFHVSWHHLATERAPAIGRASPLAWRHGP